MAQHDSALSELARRLAEVVGTLASSVGEILGAALQKIIEVDRLVHHAEIIVLRGDSYRLKNHSTDSTSNTDL